MLDSYWWLETPQTRYYDRLFKQMPRTPEVTKAESDRRYAEQERQAKGFSTHQPEGE